MRAISNYLAPMGVDTLKECNEKHPGRRFALKPEAYKKLALASAKLAGVDERDAILNLVADSSFWPDAPAATDERRQAANQVASVLERLRSLLDELYPVEQYFNMVEELRIVPIFGDADACVIFEKGRANLDLLRIPSAIVASKSLGEQTAVLVGARQGDSEADFEAAVNAGTGVKIKIERIHCFLVGAARLHSGVRPVGIFASMLVNGDLPTLSEQMPYDFLPGW